MTAVVEADAVRSSIEACYENGWTDGLPVVPCTQELLDAFLAQTTLAPDEIVLEMPSLGRGCTVRMAAINAAMAGCLPEYFPVVLAAWESMRNEGYTAGIWQSTTGTAPVIVVNGSVRSRLGINSRGNVFGPGFRANATIGRAIRLTVLNVFGIKPHELDQSTQGTPAKFTCVIGENQEESPWPAFHEDAGFAAEDSAATVMTLRSAIHIEARHTADAQQLLADIAGTIARTGSLMFRTNSTCLVLSPEHAHLLASQGWSKASIAKHLYDTAVLTQDELDSVGKGAISTKQHWRLASDHADAVPDDLIGSDGRLHVLSGETAVQVVVAGSSNSGVSMVLDIFDLKNPKPSTISIDRYAAEAPAQPVDHDAVDASLTELSTLLSRDGFTASWEATPQGELTFTIGPGTAECADCLVPEPILAVMIGEALKGTGARLGKVLLPSSYPDASDG
ncbi:MAG: hypothetical protein JWP31_1155 [Aeromicrobium sp.]|nr:hypothetical protein [Aeromicrobium sp.]